MMKPKLFEKVVAAVCILECLGYQIEVKKTLKEKVL